MWVDNWNFSLSTLLFSTSIILIQIRKISNNENNKLKKTNNDHNDSSLTSLIGATPLIKLRKLSLLLKREIFTKVTMLYILIFELLFNT